MLKAGYLKDKVGLLEQTTTNDPTWGSTPQWNPVGTVWARVTPVSATERAANAGVQTAITHRVTMRYRDDVTSKHRITYRGRMLEIVGAYDPDGRRCELLIDAREYPAEGGANV